RLLLLRLLLLRLLLLRLLQRLDLGFGSFEKSVRSAQMATKRTLTKAHRPAFNSERSAAVVELVDTLA
ncbi:MAG: hypothetical protein ACO3JL_11765, partial [Myxococcota bacterium]